MHECFPQSVVASVLMIMGGNRKCTEPSNQAELKRQDAKTQRTPRKNQIHTDG